MNTVVELTGVNLPGEIEQSRATVPRPQSGRLNQIIEGGWLICLFAVVAGFCVRPGHSADEDLWWHLRTGAWILQHRVAPIQDVFASSTFGKPWIAYTWLFDVLVAKLFDAGGLKFILALTTLLTIGFLACLVLLLSRHGRMFRAMALSALVVVATAPLVTPRPWLFTCIFFVLELYFLMHARERCRAVWLLPLLPLFALWANVHIQFIYGLGIIALFALERPIASLLKWPIREGQLRSRWFWASMAAAGLATMLNPYGWRLYSVVVQYATQTAPLHYIEEMQAMQFRSASDWTVLVLVCWALFALAGSKQRSALMLSLLAVSIWFGFRTGRDAWFPAVIAALVLVSPSEGASPGQRRVPVISWSIAVPVAVALVLGLLTSETVSPKALQKVVEQRFPERAVAYIREHRMRTPLYNSFGWGGYLMWRLPSMPVSIDGRANLYGDARLIRFTESWSGRASWSSDPELMKAKTILLERDCPLASILRSDSRYRMVYDDDVASVFEPLPRDEHSADSRS